MNVLFLSSWFPNRTSPLNGDFVERHAMAVSSECSAAVLYVTFDLGPVRGLFEICEFRKGHLYEVIIYFNRRSRPLNQLLYLAAYLVGYIKIRKNWGKPEIIHANIINPVVGIARLFNILFRIPYVISEHWTGYLNSNEKKPNIGKFAQVIGVKKAYAIIPVSINLQKSMQNLGFQNRFFVVPNVVDTDKFRPISVTSARSIKRILHVSSMKEDHKNIAGILSAIAQMKKLRSDFIITFIGAASDEQKKQVSTLGISSETVIFAGEKSHDDVAQAMQQSDFLVMFSRFENLPCVILEAIATGLPVISSDVGGISEWVKNTSGLLVKSEDEESFMRAMIWMIDHYHEFDKYAMHRFATENFSIPVIASQFCTIYKQAIQSRLNV